MNMSVNKEELEATTNSRLSTGQFNFISPTNQPDKSPQNL